MSNIEKLLIHVSVSCFSLGYTRTINVMNTSAWSVGSCRFSLAEPLGSHEERDITDALLKRYVRQSVTLEVPLLQST